MLCYCSHEQNARNIASSDACEEEPTLGLSTFSALTPHVSHKLVNSIQLARESADTKYWKCSFRL